ncbi:endonuclease/exonuclease/phosphatase family protein [Streptomyces sp. NPDC014724]|uniref:endonuclease/exonuclease/phosphatase family protein n=1 Tax=unclassified Streptomyces TaxID=2593676 RepID=UPI0036F712A8
MRRTLSFLIALLALIAGVSLASAPVASATDVSADAVDVAKSAGQKWALRSVLTGRYVSVELNDTDQYEWRMKARSEKVGSWEKFTLHTNHAGTTMSLRSLVTGFFATAEYEDAGDRNGMLRARGYRLGSWQQFTAHYSTPPAFLNSPAGSVGVSFESVDESGYAGRWVAVTGDGTLRAMTLTPGEETRFVLEPVDAPTEAPYAGSAPASSLNVMTWNVCANANRNCGWNQAPYQGEAGYQELNDAIRERLVSSVIGGYPDVIFFQEFCEKHAKRVEEMLEAQTGRGWDVRFAPIHNRVGGSPLIQKQCAMGGESNADRGAYGIALAVPDENTWYRRYELTSPADKEQRTALCASIPSRAVMACTAHFSAGKGYDDNDGSWRTKQAVQLRDLANTFKAKGYRPVFGGDLNLVPPVPDATVDEGGPSTALNPVYDAYQECGQLNGLLSPRTGKPTANADANGNPTRKLDYIFAPHTFSRCSVSATAGKSDHWTLYGAVPLPAV